MLRRLLESAAGRGSGSLDELAAELDVSIPLLRAMLEELCRLGYLKEIVEGCSVPCAACSLHDCCLTQNQAKIWSLTTAGERFLGEVPHG